MKSKLVLAALALALAILPAHGDPAEANYRKGLAAMNSGDVTAARNSFNEALRLRPGHASARFQLGQLKTNEGALVAKRREAQLAAVRIPEVKFDNIALSDALAALGHLIDTQSNATEGEKEKAFTPNFMIQDPSGELEEREVTLNLKSVPAKIALDYMLDQAGATVRYDAHATIIRPAARAAAPVTTSEE